MAVVPQQESQSTTGKKAAVWAFVLHYQAPQETVTCLESLLKLDYGDLKILLLDNGSPDRSGDAVAKQFPNVEYVRLEENLGFAGGCNAGIAYCVKRGADWVWLLNNDARVAPNSLSLLMQAAANSPKAALLGGRVYTPSGNDWVPSGGGQIDFERGKTFERQAVPEGADTVACDWISGCNLLVRTAAFQ